MLCFVELKLNKMKLEKTEDKITQEYRDSLIYFNLKNGHTWYDIINDKLYDEYGYCRNTEANNYLLSIGAIDEQNNKLFQFEE